MVELQPRDLPGLVHGRPQRALKYPRRQRLGRGDGEQRNRAASVNRCGHHDQVRDVPVDDMVGEAVEDVSVVLARCRHAGAVVRHPRRDRERGDQVARGDLRQERLARGHVARSQQRVGRQHDGREVGGAEQHPAHLLQDDR